MLLFGPIVDMHFYLLTLLSMLFDLSIQLEQSTEDVYCFVKKPSSVSFLYRFRLAKSVGEPFQQSMRSVRLVPTQPFNACERITNANQVRRHIALSIRGGCSFTNKAVEAEYAGAAAVIVMDSERAHQYVEMIDDGSEKEITIPAVFMLGVDGFMILQALENESLSHAIVDIPVNLTYANMNRLNFPTWSL